MKSWIVGGITGLVAALSKFGYGLYQDVQANPGYTPDWAVLSLTFIGNVIAGIVIGLIVGWFLGQIYSMIASRKNPPQAQPQGQMPYGYPPMPYRTQIR